jgi:hypothetical protein
MTRFAIAVLVSLMLGVPAVAEAANWGAFQSNHCTKPGFRQHSAVLWNIPWGYSWERACWETGANINGYNFSSPARCVNNGQMWGQFDVPDNSCSVYWGSFQADGCIGYGRRQYSAILWNIPSGYSWEQACAATPATVVGQYFARPSRCVNNGYNMWGQFDVVDSSCP